MEARTMYLSRLLGFYCIVVALAMVSRRQVAIEAITEMLNSSAALLAVGLIAVIVGLAIIVGHNVWHGGALPVLVTLIGWWSLAKGLACLFLPQETLAQWIGGQRYEHLYYVSPILSLPIGFYLIYASSMRKPEAEAGA